MDITSLVPHRSQMLLIDSVESFDAAERRVVASVRPRADSLFCDGDGIPAWVAIEYMAQASAALAGLVDAASSHGEKPRPGLLLGTRRLSLSTDRFETGKTYRISSVCSFEDTDAAVFQCEIVDEDGNTAASASLTTCRPPDMAAFMKEHTGK